MAKRLAREWRLKFYLNAYHYITINGTRGETHPHTWEFIVHFRIPNRSFVPFYEFENGIAAFLEPYNGQVLNETDTFRDVLPTLEGIVETFLPQFDRILTQAGGQLISVEGSESPTRAFIVRVLDEGAEPNEDVEPGAGAVETADSNRPVDDEDRVDELIHEALK